MLDADAFLDETEWQLSRKGNRFRRLADGVTITIFPGRGGYHWGVWRNGHMVYSGGAYDSERAAMAGAFDLLEVA
jgi:hypothetical protein